MSTLGLIATVLAAIVVAGIAMIVVIVRRQAVAPDPARPKTVADLVRLRAEEAARASASGPAAAEPAVDAAVETAAVAEPAVDAEQVAEPPSPVVAGPAAVPAADDRAGDEPAEDDSAAGAEREQPLVPLPGPARSNMPAFEGPASDTPWGRGARMTEGDGVVWSSGVPYPAAPVDEPAGTAASSWIEHEHAPATPEAAPGDWSGYSDWAEVDAAEDNDHRPARALRSVPAMGLAAAWENRATVAETRTTNDEGDAGPDADGADETGAREARAVAPPAAEVDLPADGDGGEPADDPAPVPAAAGAATAIPSPTPRPVPAVQPEAPAEPEAPAASQPAVAPDPTDGPTTAEPVAAQPVNTATATEPAEPSTAAVAGAPAAGPTTPAPEAGPSGRGLSVVPTTFVPAPTQPSALDGGDALVGRGPEPDADLAPDPDFAGITSPWAFAGNGIDTDFDEEMMSDLDSSPDDELPAALGLITAAAGTRAPARARRSPAETAAEQAAADLALLRTFGFADPTGRPDGAPVVAMEGVGDSAEAVEEGTSQPVGFRVVGRDGAAVPGATVTLLDDRGRETAGATADSAGRGTLQAPRPGSYVLVSTAADHQPGAVAITVAEAPAEAELLLARSASMSGTVYGEDGPLVGARLTLVQDGEIVDSVETGAEGVYRIPDLAAGEYGLSVTAPDCEPIAEMLEILDGAELRHDVDLDPAGLPAQTVASGVDDDLMIGHR